MHYVGLLIATFFPPVIVALLNRGTFSKDNKAYSPKTQHTGGSEGFPGWTKSFTYQGFGGAQQTTADATFYHAFDILIVINIASCNIHNLSSVHTKYQILKHGGGNDDGKFKFNVLPGLYFTDAYGIEGNPANDNHAVTLNNPTSGGTSFQSKATITITRAQDNKTDLSNLNLSGGSLTINITSGTIKNASNDLQTTAPTLNNDDVLALEARGTLSGEVTLEGIIVVTSTGHKIGNSLSVAGGPSSGVSGSLTLRDDGDKHVSITKTTSSLTIDKTAFDALESECKTTTTLKIGDCKSNPRVATTATGVAQTLGLNKEEYFKKYWHLLPNNI